MESRPLDLAGVFDRAASLCIRNAAPLLGVAAVATVPVAIVQYVVDLRAGPQLDAALRQMENPQSLSATHLPSLPHAPEALGLTIGSLLFGYLMLAFATAALGAGVARIYQGARPGLRACYAPVLARLPSIAGLLLSALAALIVSYVAAFVVVAIPVASVALALSNSAATILPFAVTAMLLAMSFALALLGAVAGCALFAIVIEGDSAPAALRVSVRRICNRRQLGRALVCAMGIGGVTLAVSALVDLAAVGGLSRWPLASIALDAAARTVVVPFAAAVLAVYYFDVRARDARTSLDDALPASSEPTPDYAPTRYLSGEERALIADFLERRERLTPQRRGAIAARLAAPARQRVPQELARLDDESLLERL
ncbi:MAG TPA: hypothetical protein VGX91_02220 [Candidatus Cybelea sp.]|jgi:hypothetical protein|nr:hypothetical protein [Candidatus Cybelea sp.]